VFTSDITWKPPNLTSRKHEEIKEEDTAAIFYYLRQDYSKKLGYQTKSVDNRCEMIP
jgi:hypothetical protein